MTERGDTNYSLFSTVNTKMEYFTRADIEVADRARELQHLQGWRSDKQFINSLSNNLIINCTVLLDDMKRAHASYKPATNILKG